MFQVSMQSYISLVHSVFYIFLKLVLFYYLDYAYFLFKKNLIQRKESNETLMAILHVAYNFYNIFCRFLD